MAYGAADTDISEMDEMSNGDRISLIVYGGALEYCRLNKKRIFFNETDIKESLQMASLKTNEAIGTALSYARMPDWVNDIVENLPQDKIEGIKKK